MFYGFLVSMVPVLIAKIILALGVGVFTYTGVNILLGSISDLARGALAGSGGQYIGLIGLAGVDVACNIILSAVAARLVLQSVNGVVSRVTLTNKNVV